MIAFNRMTILRKMSKASAPFVDALNEYVLKFKNNNSQFISILFKIIYVLSVILAITSISIILLTLYYYLFEPNFINVREGIHTGLAYTIKSGKYFSLEYYPRNLYLYGPLQGFLLSLVSAPTLLINRMLSCFFLVLCWLPIYFIIRTIFIDKPYKLILSIYLWSYTGLLAITPLGANTGSPDILGLFLYIIAMAIILSEWYLERDILARIFIASLMTILCVLTKQYYGIVIASFFIHEFIHQKKLCFFISTSLIITIFIVTTYFWMPIYFLSFNHFQHDFYYSTKSVELTYSVLFKNWYIFIPFIFISLKCFSMSGIIQKKYKMIILYTIFIFLFLSLSLGGHTGNFLTYWNELLIPLILIIFIFSLITLRPIIYPLVCILIFISVIPVFKNSYYGLTKWSSVPIYNKELSFLSTPFNEVKNNNSYNYVCTNFFYAPSYNDEFDGGQIGYLYSIHYHKLIRKIFPKLNLIPQKNKQYRDELIDKIRNRKFDKIYYFPGCFLNIPDILSLIEQNYNLIGEYELFSSASPDYKARIFSKE